MTSDKALIFDIKRDCSEDGPGIRTTVFFKGCPLHCVWCQNPEGISPARELTFQAAHCHPQQCGAPCVSACPEGALKLAENQLEIDRRACNHCDKCIDACASHALESAGYWITLDELLYRVTIDRPFYDSSGGGVTLSGGEATRQMDFAEQFLIALKCQGIHTALETCGFFNYRRFRQQLLPHLDLIYFDLKLINDAESGRYTGQSNRLILENFMQLIKEAKIPVIPRIPLIPGITTTAENLAGIARFIEANGVSAATLMPYNPLWRDKAAKVGRPLDYQRTRFMSEQEKEQCVIDFSNHKQVKGVHHAD